MRRAKLVEPTEVFGDYLVFERLGIGGMATVHRAIRRGIEGFEQVVALKRLLPHLAADAQFVESFVREAKLASLLQHQRIIQIYDLGCFADTYFIAMEYVEGCDLRELLRSAHERHGPPPLDVGLSILGELCEGLHYAHTRVDANEQPLGLVHRDISPSNLLITQSGNLKIIDFGIAKATSGELRTDSGRIKGKCPYMSPEAIQGKALDARSDIFSTGIIAFELLTARPLFASKSDYETLTKVQFAEAFPPSFFNRDCPLELDDVVLKALEKEPGDRWESIAAMREEIDKVALKHRVHATPRRVTEWISQGLTGATSDADAGDAATTQVKKRNPDALVAPVSTTAPGADDARGRVPMLEPQTVGDLVKIVWGRGEPSVVDDETPTLDDVPPAPFETPGFAPLGSDLLPPGALPPAPLAPGLLSASRLVDVAPPDAKAKVTFRVPEKAADQRPGPTTLSGWEAPAAAQAGAGEPKVGARASAAPAPVRAGRTLTTDTARSSSSQQLAASSSDGGSGDAIVARRPRGTPAKPMPGVRLSDSGIGKWRMTDALPSIPEETPVAPAGGKAWILVIVLALIAATLAVVYAATR